MRSDIQSKQEHQVRLLIEAASKDTPDDLTNFKTAYNTFKHFKTKNNNPPSLEFFIGTSLALLDEFINKKHIVIKESVDHEDSNLEDLMGNKPTKAYRSFFNDETFYNSAYYVCNTLRDFTLQDEPAKALNIHRNTLADKYLGLFYKAMSMPETDYNPNKKYLEKAGHLLIYAKNRGKGERLILLYVQNMDLEGAFRTYEGIEDIEFSAIIAAAELQKPGGVAFKWTVNNTLKEIGDFAFKKESPKKLEERDYGNAITAYEALKKKPNCWLFNSETSDQYQNVQTILDESKKLGNGGYVERCKALLRKMP
ncbi:hypothetical protein KY366_04735 [Candidatus Woesearchaeota archaeon]|nr:hypothetical protein [Candidatus Woesearchaeota archaeon]